MGSTWFGEENVESERGVVVRGEPGDAGGDGGTLSQEAGDDVVGLAGEVADVGVVPVDADGVAVVGVGGLGDEGEGIAGGEFVEEVVGDVVFVTSKG